MILYKYRGNSTNTDKIFTDKKVWLSNAAGLNDPFECSIQEIAKDWIDEHVKEMKQGHLSGLVFAFIQSKKSNTHFFGLSISEAEKFMETFKTLANFDEQYNHYREFMKSRNGHYPSDPNATFSGFDSQLNEAGIFSLSETSENQLMWSHYAEDTKGIAIGFEVGANSKLSDNDHCVKVNYSDTLPAFKGKGFLNQISFFMDECGRPYSKSQISFSDPTFKLAISTKPTVWRYEQEWRYIEERSGGFPLPGRITEIVFGLKCSAEIRSKYKALVKSNFKDYISFYEIQKVPNTNSIIKVKIAD
jgi:hypothetical protein